MVYPPFGALTGRSVNLRWACATGWSRHAGATALYL